MTLSNHTASLPLEVQDGIFQKLCMVNTFLSFTVDFARNNLIIKREVPTPMKRAVPLRASLSPLAGHWTLLQDSACQRGPQSGWANEPMRTGLHLEYWR